jgi:YD repeat-containing protein
MQLTQWGMLYSNQQDNRQKKLILKNMKRIVTYIGLINMCMLLYLVAWAITTTYIYGYNNSLVMATVVNAGQDQVAFSSFESNDKGFWTYTGTTAGGAGDPARTGSKYYTLSSGNISRTGLKAGKYVVSYWSQGGAASLSGTNFTLVSQTSNAAIGNWALNECIVSLSANGSSVTISGSVKVDELRLHPVEAQMTTCTFDALIGKTSETDQNNRTMYYEYDEFNRIKCMKDQYGNIRQSFVYHYKNQ